MNKVIAFLKTWGAAIAGVLLALLGAGWMWQRKQAEIAKLKDQAAVDKALKDMEALRAVRERVVREEGATATQIETIDRSLSDNKRRIVEAHEGMEGLKDAEVDDAFSRLGY